MRPIIGAGLAAGAIASGAIYAVQHHHACAIDAEIQALLQASQPNPGILAETDLEPLPPPVQRWLRRAQVVGRERPTTVRLRQAGDFRLAPDKPWMPYTAEQYFTTKPPGFIWVAHMRMAPLVQIFGRDRYAAGEGSISMRLMSLIPLANQRGGQLNQGAMLRYLGETTWFPAGVVSPFITWETIDEHMAKATMSYAGETTSATFFVDDDGHQTSMTANRLDNSRGTLESWSGRGNVYGERDGMHIPIAGDAAWHYAAGDFDYIRWRITDLEQDRPQRWP